MPGPLTDHDPVSVLAAERDIRGRLGGSEFDFGALAAVSNIYRAANSVRNRIEREVLSGQGISWGGFTILFVLWIWGDRETGELAEECGLAKGTLTGMLTTLERAHLVERSRHPDDGRRVLVHLRSDGRSLIEEVFPIFNAYEAKVTDRLTEGEKEELARLLRIVTATADDLPLVAEA